MLIHRLPPHDYGHLVDITTMTRLAPPCTLAVRAAVHDFVSHPFLNPSPRVRHGRCAYSTSISTKIRSSARPLIPLASCEVFPSTTVHDGMPASDLRTNGSCRRLAGLGGRTEEEKTLIRRFDCGFCAFASCSRPGDLGIPNKKPAAGGAHTVLQGYFRRRRHFLWSTRQAS